MDCVLRARAPEQYALLLVRVNSTRIYWQWYCSSSTWLLGLLHSYLRMLGGCVLQVQTL